MQAVKAQRILQAGLDVGADFVEIFEEEIRELHEKKSQLALLVIEDNVDICFANRHQKPLHGEQIFTDVLDSTELARLWSMSVSQYRALYAIELIERRYSLPDELKKKILRLYDEPGFIIPIHPR